MEGARLKINLAYQGNNAEKNTGISGISISMSDINQWVVFALEAKP
jgi:hypothetical protein